MQDLPQFNLEREFESPSTHRRKIRKIFFVWFLWMFVPAVFYFLFLNTPRDFPVGVIIRIEKGESLRSVSLKLKTQHIIRSRTAFEVFVIMYGSELRIQYADYMMDSRLAVWQVARRISKGEYRMPAVVVTIPEGFTNAQIAETFAVKLQNFNKEKFLTEAKNYQGYLFPDTYFFLTTDNEESVLEAMKQNFEKKFVLLRSDLFLTTEEQVIIMASIVEKEAKGDDDRDVIAGILWRRVAGDMALQVDAAPDTYKTKGLPKIPICNPGLDAIKSAIYSVTNSHSLPPYLYYLHDKSGVVHYARTFAEHRQNILKYLK